MMPSMTRQTQSLNGQPEKKTKAKKTKAKK